MSNWIQRREAVGIKVKAILKPNYFFEKIINKNPKSKTRDVKFLNEKLDFNSLFCIYNKSSMFIYETEKSELVLINNLEIIKMFKYIFELIWESLPDIGEIKKIN